MLLTPNAAHARRISAESPCCVPTFIRALGDGPAWGLAGVRAACAETIASASAPIDTPAPAFRTNSRRSIRSSDHGERIAQERRIGFPLRPVIVTGRSEAAG